MGRRAAGADDRGRLLDDESHLDVTPAVGLRLLFIAVVSALLDIEDLEVTFGRTAAVRGVSIASTRASVVLPTPRGPQRR